MKYSRAMAEKLTKSILDAYNRAPLGDLGPAFDVAERAVFEIIADVRLVVASDLEVAFARVADVDVATVARGTEDNDDGKEANQV